MQARYRIVPRYFCWLVDEAARHTRKATTMVKGISLGIPKIETQLTKFFSGDGEAMVRLAKYQDNLPSMKSLLASLCLFLALSASTDTLASPLQRRPSSAKVQLPQLGLLRSPIMGTCAYAQGGGAGGFCGFGFFVFITFPVLLPLTLANVLGNILVLALNERRARLNMAILGMVLGGVGILVGSLSASLWDGGDMGLFITMTSQLTGVAMSAVSLYLALRKTPTHQVAIAPWLQFSQTGVPITGAQVYGSF